jgi:hypothetical protein
MSRLPGALLSFYNGAVAVVIARKIGADRSVQVLVAVAAASAFGYFALQPLVADVADTVTLALHLGEAPEAHRPPYGFYEYKFIYGMFIEPTIASFALISLLWPALSGSKGRRIALFTVLLLLIRGRVVATFPFSFWIKDSLPMALAAEGQFRVETALLAVLTELTWATIAPSVIARGPVDA